MASWKEIVTKSPTSSQISAVSVQAAVSFGGTMAATNGGTGQDLSTLGDGIIYAQSGSWDVIAPAANEVIGIAVGGGFGSVDIASSHVHSNLIATNGDSEVSGELVVNGNLTVDTLTVENLDVTISGDNFFTVNSLQAAATAGFEVYLDGTNDARLQWDNSQERWEFGIVTGAMYAVGGVYTQSGGAWTGDPTASSIKTGALGLDTASGSCYIAVP